jgi:hypothetical protein
MVGTILLIIALILFILAAIPVPSRFNLGWAGLAVWVLSILLGGGGLAAIIH